MKKNVGSIDRGFRIVLAIIIAVLYFTSTITGVLGTVLLVFGGIFLVTGLIGTCPIYSLLGMNTCKR